MTGDHFHISDPVPKFDMIHRDRTVNNGSFNALSGQSGVVAQRFLLSAFQDGLRRLRKLIRKYGLAVKTQFGQLVFVFNVDVAVCQIPVG